MRAFLSHSSKDKHFVRQVANNLSAASYELDERTLDYTLNALAIRRALERCSAFVFFLSKDSIKSPFVAEEQRAALEARGKGFLKRILIIALDDTSYRDLPAWMQEINVATRLTSAKACARKIHAMLLDLEAENKSGTEIYVGREDEEKALRKALTPPPGEAPVAIHAVGHFGIGRRTFLRNSLRKLFPRVIDDFVEITLSRYQGPEDLYRSLYDLHKVTSLEGTLKDFEAFSLRSPADKILALKELVLDICDHDEFIFVNDEAGVYTESGDYQPFLKELITSLAHASRPVLGFIQNRMMRLSLRAEKKEAFHIRLSELNGDHIRELVSFSLKQAGIAFTSDQLITISEQIDGHPYNVRFAIVYIENYGIDSLINDPSELIEWKRRRAEDFLRKVEFSDGEAEIIAALLEYRFISTAALISVLDLERALMAAALRKLEDFCCIERREGYYHISSPIREAVRRDARFQKSDEWKKNLSLRICDLIGDYKDDDHVPVSLLESATVAAARSASGPLFLTNLVLPSHLLRIARDHYDNGQRRLCIEFCERAYAMKGRLTPDGEVEVLRLWGLSAIRLNDLPVYNDVIVKLRAKATKLARRIAFFTEGFFYRTRGDLDNAESKFLEAWKLDSYNESINRELAKLYCKQRRYNEAESYARAAYQIAPTNPYIIDIMTEMLLGKMQHDLYVDTAEVNKLLGELKIYGDAPGSSFYLMRLAHSYLRNHELRLALNTINRAVERTPALLPAYFLRADILLALQDIAAAEADLTEIGRLLEKQGGFSEGDEAQVQELTVRILMEKQQLTAARRVIETSAFLPKSVQNRLSGQLARLVGFMPHLADSGLQEWAKKYGSPSKGKALGRRGKKAGTRNALPARRRRK